ncbi:related to exocyst complex 100 kDa component [Cephalotrichum gorgonifer]|uniref:Related to exocyst complex 100 kDa component n=1 Tax=Cephalotrichum gorgonifer TaxID=2041049 RepID=A0AAE8MP83_9PEZI|nr:related to exocyst complex 100 kDa component [Cephalotrichum gorgonifer]
MERAGSSARTLFPRGPSFTLEDFSSTDFTVRDFIDNLAETAVPANRKSGPSQNQFDPKPLIRTFENALSQLGELAGDLQEKESELLSQARRADITHNQTLDTLGRKLDQSIDAFETLNISLNSGAENASKDAADGNAAVQIGERLEDLDRKRRRALDASFLIRCWTEVSETGQLTSLEDIQRQPGPENKVRCAVIASQLMRISQRLDTASWSQANGAQKRGSGAANGVNGAGGGGRAHNTREILEKFSETLEQDLLKQFNDSYRRQNFDDMRECAKVLHDFNGGSSVIATFVNQHQFFIDRDQLVSDEVTVDNEAWELIADPDSESPGVDPGLQSLVDEVKLTMQEESFIIKRAFPYYETVLIKFIQRVFQQSIQQRLEAVLDKAASISSLAFLRTLHASRAYINSLVEDLKSHGLTEHPEICSAQISQTLDQQLEELFIPYLVGNSYIDREKKSLDELNSSLLFKFTLYHAKRKKAPTGFMASLAQQGTQFLASAKDAYMERLDSSDLTATQKVMMLRIAGLKDSNTKTEIEVSEEDGVLSVANAKRMIKWLAEGVRRAIELGSANETAKDVNILLGLVLDSMGRVYLETGLEAALDQATSQENVKTEPDLTYLPSIRPAVTIANLMDRFITTVLVRLAESNTTVRRNMEAQRRMGMDSIEQKTNAVIKSTVAVVTNWVAKSLNSQRKTDFRPRDGELLDSLQTPTCLQICTFLSRVSTQAGAAVDGDNLEALESEVALSVLKLLFDHFKKFQVNATGGLMVTQDIAKYVATLKGWGLSRQVEGTVELLTEIGSLFIVGPEALREKSRTLTTGPSGAGRKLSKVDFRAFVQRRDDLASVGIQSLLASL